ncbi:MAG TPA: hypothetical protein DCQ31_03310 [Bacteroidales bacterium]|nr:hypothetical protein [Bacteroidales bacterium]
MKYKNIVQLFNTLSARITLAILGGVIAMTLSVLIYSNVFSINKIRKEAISQAFTVSESHKLEIEALLNKYFIQARNLAAFSNNNNSRISSAYFTEEQIISLLKLLLRDNADLHAAGVIWSSDLVSPAGESVKFFDRLNRFVPIMYKNNDGGISEAKVENYEVEGAGSFYLKPMATGLNHISDPMVVNYSSKNAMEIVRISVPIIYLNNRLGVCFVDVATNQIAEYLKSLDLVKDGILITVLSSGGIIAATNFDQSIQGKHIKYVYRDWREREKITNASENYAVYSENDIRVGKPLNLLNSNSVYGLIVDYEFGTIHKQVAQNQRSTAIFVLLIASLAALMVVFVVKRLLAPIKKVVQFSEQIVSGSEFIKPDVAITASDVSEIISNLYKASERLKRITIFSEQIGKGNLEVRYLPVSDTDKVGDALTLMLARLKESRETAQQRNIELKDNEWVRIGVEKFNILFRQTDKSVEDFSYDIIKNLAEFTGCGLGGIYLVNEKEETQNTLNLIASYAFSKRKRIKEHVLFGQGLVGTCAVEQANIHLTEIPDDYSEISSSLGQAQPKSIFIMPLNLKNSLLGVVELASFNLLTSVQIKFIEGLKESIALTLAATIANSRTNLLLERARQQAEELAAQEEEMRQNLEELQATQEESARKERENETLIYALNNSALVAEYNRAGIITFANDSFIEAYNIPKELIIGRKHKHFSSLAHTDSIAYDNFWGKLLNGEPVQLVQLIENVPNKLWLSETYSPIRDEMGGIDKVLCISYNITDSMHNADKLRNQFNEAREKLVIMAKKETEIMKSFEEMQAQLQNYRDEADSLKRENEKLSGIKRKNNSGNT